MNQFTAEAEHPAFSVTGGLEIPILFALLHRGQKMLAPVFDPFDRPPQPQSSSREHDFLGIHDELGAEPAADIRRHDANLVFVALQEPHQERPHLVSELRR